MIDRAFCEAMGGGSDAVMIVRDHNEEKSVPCSSFQLR